MKKPILFLFTILIFLSLSCNALRPGGIRQITPTPSASPSTPTGGPPPLAGSDTPLPTSLARADEVTPPRAAAPTHTPIPPTATRRPTRARPTATATSGPAVSAPPLAGQVGEPTIGDPYIPELGNAGYDVLHYALQITLDPAQVYVPAAAITLTAASTLEALGRFSLDFIGFNIDALKVNGQDAYWERADGKLIVSPPAPLGLAETFTVEVIYHGEPVSSPSPYVPFDDHLGLVFRTGLNRLYVISEPDGARYWFPCNDHPRDKATFRFEVTAPQGLVGIANGVLVDTAAAVPNAFPNGRAGDRFTWEENHPMATYLATAAVGDYVRVEGVSPQGVKLRSYVFPNQRPQMEMLTPTIGEALDWMSELFGPYPFDEFGFVTVNGLGGALETQDMVILGALNEEVMIHELAHMWFGDLVSLDSWGEMWRNEGFATYITALWFARDDPGALDATVRNWERAFEGRDLYPLDDPPPPSLFGLQSYYGGALMVHALRGEIGDEAFFNGLRSYLQRYADSAASDAQFQEEMEAAAGRSLDDFFARWIKDS